MRHRLHLFLRPRALRQEGIEADCSDLFSHLKIELPTAQLATASAVLADLKLI